MDISKVGYAVLLLLPGFLFVKGFNWSGRPRRYSDFELTIWSIFLSVIILAIMEAIFTIWTNEPSYNTLLSDPSKVSPELRTGTIIAGFGGGWLLGFLDNKGWIQRGSIAVGLNLQRSVDVWQTTLGSRRYVRVTLRDGTVLWGWILKFSNNRRDVAEFVLTQAYIWDEEAGDFAPYDEGTEIYIEVGSVSYMEVIPGVF